MLYLYYGRSRLAEDVEASREDALDKLKRSFSDRLRSEKLQHQRGKAEQDEKIQQLGDTVVTVKSQVAELTDETKANGNRLNQSRGRGQKVKCRKERATLSKGNKWPMSRKPDMKKERKCGQESGKSIQDSNAEVITPEPINSNSEDELSSISVKERIQFYENLTGNNQETPQVHGRLPVAKQPSCRRKISFLSKRKSSQTKIT